MRQLLIEWGRENPLAQVESHAAQVTIVGNSTWERSRAWADTPSIQLAGQIQHEQETQAIIPHYASASQVELI